MKKEVLLSLLMTTPVAFPALADINLPDLTKPGENGSAWKSEASSFIDGYGVHDGTGMYCPVGIKSISRTLTLPQGEYAIELNGTNCKLIVNEAGDANVTVITNRQKVVTGFKVLSGKKQSVTVKIVPVNANKDDKGNVVEEDFYFSSLDLTLKFNFWTEYNDTYKSSFEKLSYPENIWGNVNTSETAIALRAAREQLVKEYQAAWDNLNAIGDNQTLDTYTKFELWANPNALEVSTKALAAKIDEHNAKVKAENTRFENFTTNTGNKSYYTWVQEDLVRKAESLSNDIKAVLADKNHKDYQYVKDQKFDERCAALLEALPGLKTLINETFPADLMETEIDIKNLQDKVTALDNEYQELNSFLNGASEDMLAYNSFNSNNNYLEVLKAYQQALIDLSEDPATPKKGYPTNAFAEKMVELSIPMDKAMDAAKAFVTVKVVNGVESAVLNNISGAATQGKAQAALEAIAEASDLITANMQEWADFTAAQNAEMATAYADVAAANTTLKDVTDNLAVPSQFQSQYDKLVNNVKAAIETMKGVIDAAYGKDLAAPATYADQKAEVVEQQGILDDFNIKAGNLNDVYGSYNDLKADVKKVDVDGFLEGLYANDYAEIDALFAALTKIDDKTKIDAIKDRIETLKSASGDLVEAFGNANVMTDYNSFVTYATTKKTILDPASKLWTNTLKQMTDAKVVKGVNDINDKINAIIKAHTPTSVMDTYNSIVALNVKAGELKDQINDYRKDFTKKASAENLAYAQAKVNYINEVLANAVFAKSEAGDANKAAVEEKVAALQTKINDQESKINGGDGSVEKTYNEIDAKIKGFVNTDVPAIEKLIKKTIDNYAAYNTLLAEQTNLVKEIDNVKTTAMNVAKSPAQEYYLGLINRNAKKTGYYDKADAIATDINNAYAAIKTDESKSAAALKSSLSQTIKDFLNGTVTPLKGAIALNEQSHDEQLQASTSVRTVLSNIEAQLKATADQGNFNPFEAQLKKLSEDLLALDRQVTTEYGKGASNALSLGGIVAKYDAIADAAKAILDEFTPNYNKAVAEENERLLGEFGWTKLSKELNDTYYNSVQTFIDFAYNVTNLGYKAHIEANGGFHDISALFTYQPEIGEIQNAVLKYVLECNSVVDENGKPHDPELITEEGLADWMRDATALKADMKAVGDNALAQANAFAESYWQKIWEDATNGAPAIYAANEATLKAGGVDDKFVMVPDPKDNKKEVKKYVVTVLRDALATGTTAIANAKNLAYVKTDKGELTDTRKEALGSVMNEIANELDKVKAFTPAELQTIAMNMWVASHKATTDRLTEMNADFAKFDFVSADAMKTPKENFDKAVKAIGTLNTKAVKVNEGLLGEKLNDFMTDLETEWNKANDEYTAIKKINDTNSANKALFDAYTADIADLRADFKVLCDFGGTLAADNACLAQIANAIANLENIVNGNKADYTEAVKTTIVNAVKSIKENTIPSGYGEVAKAEVKALQGMVLELRSSWAEDSKDGKDIDLDAYRTQIDDFEKTYIVGTPETPSLLQQVNDIINDPEIESVEETIEPLVALGAEMRALEAELSDIQIALKKSWGNDILGDLIKDLSATYIAIDNNISSLTNYDETLQEKYGEEFEGFKTRLDAIKDAWEAAGNNAIMQENNYTDGMNALAAEVNDALAAVKADQKVIDTHRAAYADLNAKYEAQVAALDAIKNRLADDDIFFVKDTEKVDEKGNVVKDSEGKPVMINEQQEEFRADIAAIEKSLAETLKDLNEQNAKGKMNEDSVLKNWDGDNAIPAAVTALNGEVIAAIHNALKPVMTDELTALYEGIKKANILPAAKKEILAQYAALGEDAAKAVKDLEDKDGNALTGDKLIDAQIANIAAVHAILDRAEALVAAGAEKTFMIGDLDSNGDVDILDVQEIITLVGEGAAYEDLDEVKAAAADTNGDGILGVGDVAGVINASLVLPEKAKAPRFAPRAVVDGANIVAAEFVSEEAGVRRYAINIQNAASVVAGQIDLVLAEGMTLVDVVAAQRAANHDVALFHNGIANKRVILSNLENAAIEGAAGAVIYVDVIGEGQVNVDNVVFADKSSVEYRFAKPEGTTGIEDTVIDGNGSMKQRIYNAAGQMLRGIQRGVNIIRNADGSVTKEYHK
ncbi:MAG: hypothetical protein NC212_07545 [Staphylococcus sp.]|nr:hypothetical protein [Staphylococcus sp.]